MGTFRKIRNIEFQTPIVYLLSGREVPDHRGRFPAHEAILAVTFLNPH